MPIRGSFRDEGGFNPANIKAMCLATTEETGEFLKQEAEELTPEKTGKLKKGWRSSGVKTEQGATEITYTVSVYNNTLYARHVEYGTGPHEIRPKDAKALKFNDRYAAWVQHPGTEGSFMAAKAAHLVQRYAAQEIAEANAKLYLK